MNPDPKHPWALHPSTLTALESFLRSLRPVTSVECGSGLSTAVLRRHSGWVVSLEHSARWAADTLAMTEEPNGALVLADLTEVDTPVGPRPFYAVELPQSIDFALIDGPPGSVGRLGTLFALWPRLAEDAVVWLDDYARPGEQEALAVWAEHLPIRTTILSQYVAEIRRAD